MLIRDTIYSIDTVYVQQKLDSISQLDMGQHINTINSIHSNDMTKILWILGVAFTVIGIIVPFLIEKYNRKQLRNELKEELLDEFNIIVEQISEELKLEIEEATMNSFNVISSMFFFSESEKHLDNKNFDFAILNIGLNINSIRNSANIEAFISTKKHLNKIINELAKIKDFKYSINTFNLLNDLLEDLSPENIVDNSMRYFIDQIFDELIIIYNNYMPSEINDMKKEENYDPHQGSD